VIQRWESGIKAPAHSRLPPIQKTARVEEYFAVVDRKARLAVSYEVEIKSSELTFLRNGAVNRE